MLCEVTFTDGTVEYAATKEDIDRNTLRSIMNKHSMPFKVAPLATGSKAIYCFPHETGDWLGAFFSVNRTLIRQRHKAVMELFSVQPSWCGYGTSRDRYKAVVLSTFRKYFGLEYLDENIHISRNYEYSQYIKNAHRKDYVL